MAGTGDCTRSGNLRKSDVPLPAADSAPGQARRADEACMACIVLDASNPGTAAPVRVAPLQAVTDRLACVITIYPTTRFHCACLPRR